MTQGDLHGADAVVPQQELAHDLELREPGPGGATARARPNKCNCIYASFQASVTVLMRHF